MQAIILAAGMGRRLGAYTSDNTKCMLKVNGVRLIDRALSSLYEVGVSRIILVVGYKGQKVKDYLGTDYKGVPILYVDNPIYDKTNNIYSLYLASDYMTQEDTLLLESDLIFAPSVIRTIVDDCSPNIVLVDKFESWMDGTVVTINEKNHITQFIDKDHFNFNEIKDYYKTVNIYKFSKEFSAKYYVPFLSAYSTALGNNEYYEQVLRVILHLHNAPLKALPLSGESWYEIDDIQDLDIASGMFAPTEGEHYVAISSRYGGYWRYPQMLDFCYLVNPFFPPRRMIDEMKASFETLLREYPSGMRVNSLLAARAFGVNQDQIVVGNGASELIKALMESSMGKLGIILPSFEEYPNRLDEGSLVKYISNKGGFRYDAEDIKSFFKGKDINSLLLINPDNPSGNYIPFADLIDLMEWTKQQSIRFIVDESFVDFAYVLGQRSLLDKTVLDNNPHLVVLKSISKSYGVPGLRLGILASGDRSIVSRLKKQVPIWNVNSFAEFYLQIYEKYRKDYLEACELFWVERNRFLRRLGEIPFLTVYSSQANFILCKVTDKYTSHELTLKLLENNILVKDCGSKKALEGKNYIRIAVRDSKDNDYLVDTLLQIRL